MLRRSEVKLRALRLARSTTSKQRLVDWLHTTVISAVRVTDFNGQRPRGIPQGARGYRSNTVSGRRGWEPGPDDSADGRAGGGGATPGCFGRKSVYRRLQDHGPILRPFGDLIPA